jgi:hypothetical protein
VEGGILRSAAHKFGQVLCFGLLLASAASAQKSAPTPEMVAQARTWFNEAQAAEEAERWQECAERLDEALRLYETPGLLYHRAYCNEQRRYWLEALSDYHRASALIASGVVAGDVEELLRVTLPRLEGQIPSLIIQLDEIPAGAQLYISGKEYPTSVIGKALALNPGARRMTLVAPGYLAASLDVSLLPSEVRRVRLVLQEDTSALSGTGAGSAASGSAKPYVMIAEGALALAGFGAALIVQYDQVGAAGDRDFWRPGECATCGAAADNGAKTARDLRTAALISVGVGSVATAALLATLLFWPSDADGKASKVTAFALPQHGGGVGGVVLRF